MPNTKNGSTGLEKRDAAVMKPLDGTSTHLNRADEMILTGKLENGSIKKKASTRTANSKKATKAATDTTVAAAAESNEALLVIAASNLGSEDSSAAVAADPVVAPSALGKDEKPICQSIPETTIKEESSSKAHPRETIPRFYHPHGKPLPRMEERRKRHDLMKTIRPFFHLKCESDELNNLLSEQEFVSVTKACGLPRYINRALFRKACAATAAVQHHYLLKQQHKQRLLQRQLQKQKAERESEERENLEQDDEDTRSISTVSTLVGTITISSTSSSNNSSAADLNERVPTTTSAHEAPSFDLSLPTNRIGVSYLGFAKLWKALSQTFFEEYGLMFGILKKDGTNYLTADDLEIVVEDVVQNHPGLEFLTSMPVFQQRYVETVIGRIFFYKPRFWSSRMTFEELRRSEIIEVLRNLETEDDINSTRDAFSYKHFYVIYCKFWELDDDHDMIINTAALKKYERGSITGRAIERVMSLLGNQNKNRSSPTPSTSTHTEKDPEATSKENGSSSGQKKESSADSDNSAKNSDDSNATAVSTTSTTSTSSSATAGQEQTDKKATTVTRYTMSYKQFIPFILAAEDKLHPSSIGYWFRVVDLDGDGTISLHEIRHFWEEQYERMVEWRMADPWGWDDFACGLLDLANPVTSHVVTLTDLRRCANAPLFFDMMFDIRKYDMHCRRIDPTWREMDDLWITDKQNRKIKLEGWDKFAERSYEELAIEESQQRGSSYRNNQNQYQQQQYHSGAANHTEADGLGGNHLSYLAFLDELEDVGWEEPKVFQVTVDAGSIIGGSRTETGSTTGVRGPRPEDVVVIEKEQENDSDVVGSLFGLAVGKEDESPFARAITTRNDVEDNVGAVANGLTRVEAETGSSSDRDQEHDGIDLGTTGGAGARR
ncbi:Serine/threonine-protein phosphatase 2A regulatory subunit B'' subunit alpha [Quaeritorhiza haematococci]|nr:Serine/threonine-protein phosphatase 2A regulatory subunit B'' subunit alpha [Quaeritorhiza haematococci]